jgi:hypothetical protein
MRKNNVNISINQLVDFSTATDSKKKRIIRDQKSPDTFKIGWYQTPRACIKKALVNNGDIQPITEGIERLKTKIVTKPQQIQNRNVSLDAMQRFLKIKLPKILKNHSCEVIKERIVKSTFVSDVEVIVSPDVIFKVVLDGKTYIGAVKLHISKNNIFDIKKSSKVSAILYKYMSELSEVYETEVLPELCISIDVFGERVATTPINFDESINELEVICEEVKKMWFIVA